MLTATILIPLIVAVALGANVTRLSGALRPSLAVRLLAMGGVLVAMGTGISLSVVAMFLLARASRVAALGHWSRHALPNPGTCRGRSGCPSPLSSGRCYWRLRSTPHVRVSGSAWPTRCVAALGPPSMITARW